MVAANKEHGSEGNYLGKLLGENKKAIPRWGERKLIAQKFRGLTVSTRGP